MANCFRFRELALFVGWGSFLGMAGLLRCFFVVCFLGVSVFAQDLDGAKRSFVAGKYEGALEMAEKAIKNNEWEEGWRQVLIRSQMELGRYREALATTTNALRRYSSSLQLRLIAHDVFKANGREEDAARMLEELNELGSNRSWARDAESLVAMGQAAVLMGADPKLVLDNFFEPAKGGRSPMLGGPRPAAPAKPSSREPFLAAGNLALEKQDFGLAAKYFRDGLKAFPEDPNLHFGLARAFEPDDRQEMMKSLETVFKVNPRHVPALLLVVDHMIDSEAYEEAEENLAKVQEINPNHPELWAYRAVIAHVQNKEEAEKEAQEKALKFNEKNPQVKHLIGLKLSQKYRFQEGSAYQREAVKWDAKFLPAKFQLAQDLLRLGEEEEGWRLAEAVHKADEYNVGAYNLVTLKDTLKKFETFTNENFILRMSGHERSIYGDDVLKLLDEANGTLVKKYDATLAGPTTVEVFPEQKDFAIRTFGMPGGEGYLGVCFGRVITANSPASQAAHPSNWKAMLWHEFCHVVTLQLTKNRMPRWLSEGISVYEEKVANPTWGQAMNARYRDMVLKGDMKPVDEMSSAFMAPESNLHLQFAYYQSYLVVEYIVQKYGHEALKKILVDLGEGVSINDAIAKHTTKMSELNKDFKQYAESVANDLAPKLDWSKPKYDGGGNLDPAWAVAHPNNYWVKMETVARLMEEKGWEAARKPLEEIVAEYPGQTGAESAARKLALVYHELNDTEKEVAILRKLAARDAEALDVYVRLAEVDALREDWEATMTNVERARSVNPLILAPNEKGFLALRKLKRDKDAIAIGEKLLKLTPPDPTGVHFHMAEMLVDSDPARAKMHTLQALEEAPRFRDAQKLLMKLPKSEIPNPAPAAEVLK
jgi:tetratricopeptide (TPR) repeat protein